MTRLERLLRGLNEMIQVNIYLPDLIMLSNQMYVTHLLIWSLCWTLDYMLNLPGVNKISSLYVRNSVQYKTDSNTNYYNISTIKSNKI